MTKSIDTQDISAAADQLTNTIAEKLGDLADELMGRPANWSGSDAWITYVEARQNGEPWALKVTCDWHMTKLAISRAAKIDPTGDVINARRYGATWQDIAEQCGISRQAAFDRWAKYCD